MEIILAIDKILQNTIVRWVSACLAILLSLAVTIQTVRLKATDLELKAEEGRSAKYQASLATQNAAVLKAAEDKKVMEKQARDASEKVAVLKKQLQQRKTEIREIILKGPCEDMVQQVLDEVRK